MTTPPSSECPVSVYRSYDVDEYLIYVGITSRGYVRNAEHAASSAWWSRAALQRIDHYPTRREAEAVEIALIRAYRPPYNVVHNTNGPELRTAYEISRELQDRPASALLAAVKYRVPLKYYATIDGQCLFTAPLQFARYFIDAGIERTAVLRDTDQTVIGSITGFSLLGPVPVVRVQLLEPGKPLPQGSPRAKFHAGMRNKDNQVRLSSITYLLDT